jgi:Acetyltransferase (GNAT) domain
MLEIRPTRPDDLAGLAALFAESFGHGLSAAEWEWKYRQIPGEARSLVAVADGSVVAHAGALALPARWPGGKGREGLLWQLVDFAGTTRRRGLRAALVDLGRQLLADLPRPGDAPWIFGFPSERHFKLGERVFGYRPLAEIVPVAGELAPLPSPDSTVRIETGDSCGAWAEAVWEPVWRQCGGLGIRRSAAFLDWRYYARPQRYYRFYRMFSQGPDALEGFAVFAFVNDEAWAAEVWLPPAGWWYPSLLAATADLRAAGFRAWRFWPRSLFASGLASGLDPGLQEALGLRPTGERRFVGCRGRAGGPDPVAAAAGFPYAMGDYDLV